MPCGIFGTKGTVLAGNVLLCNEQILEGICIFRSQQHVERLDTDAGLHFPFEQLPGGLHGDTTDVLRIQRVRADQVAVETELLSLGRDYGYLAVLCMKEDEAAVETALRSIGFARPTQSGTGTPAEQQEALLRQKQEAEQAIADLSAALSKLGARRRDFEILSDYYGVRADKYAVLGRLPQSRHTFLVSGYVPEYRAAALASDLETRCGAAVEIEELPEDEDPPVLLKNNHFGAMTEGILKSFGLPAKGEMDPAFFTTVFYIFFGISE